MGKKRESEATDRIVALLEKTRAECGRQLSVHEIAAELHYSKGHICNVKKWWAGGMEGPVGGRGRWKPRFKGQQAPVINVPCLGNAVTRPHTVTTTFREVGGRRIPDARLCSLCLQVATEAARFD